VGSCPELALKEESLYTPPTTPTTVVCVSEDEWAKVEEELKKIGLNPRDVREEYIADFKEWLAKKGLTRTSINTYVTALSCYIRRSSPSLCLKKLSAFRKFKEYVDEVKKSDEKRRLIALAAELSKSIKAGAPVRITRYNYPGYVRAKILELLYTRGPMSVHQLSLEMSMATHTVRMHVMALVAGGYVCDKLVDRENPKVKFYAVCPSCPVKDECDVKHETKWHGVAR